MITEQDLQEAIAECLGQRNPTANTCEKLASYYIIQDRLYGRDPPTVVRGYSYASGGSDEEPRTVNYEAESEFARIINGMNEEDVWPVIDELMSVLQTVNPRLYNGVMQRLTT